MSWRPAIRSTKDGVISNWKECECGASNLRCHEASDAGNTRLSDQPVTAVNFLDSAARFAAQSTSFTDRLWLDQPGHLVSDALRVIEHFRRPNFGRLEVQITVDDPKAYTKHWTVTETMHLLPHTELMEHICEENNKDPEHMVDK